MSTAAPNPQKLLLLAALGIGAYWFASRNAQAASTGTGLAPSTYRPGQAATWASAAASLVNSLMGTQSTAKVPLLGTADGRSATVWDTTPAGADGPRFNNPSAYLTGAIDGAAYNPPGNLSGYDVVNNGYASGDPAAWWN